MLIMIMMIILWIWWGRGGRCRWSITWLCWWLWWYRWEDLDIVMSLYNLKMSTSRMHSSYFAADEEYDYEYFNWISYCRWAVGRKTWILCIIIVDKNGWAVKIGIVLAMVHEIYTYLFIVPSVLQSMVKCYCQCALRYQNGFSTFEIHIFATSTSALSASSSQKNSSSPPALSLWRTKCDCRCAKI